MDQIALLAPAIVGAGVAAAAFLYTRHIRKQLDKTIADKKKDNDPFLPMNMPVIWQTPGFDEIIRGRWVERVFTKQP